MARLDFAFYNRPTLTVARQLLGQRLVKLEANGRRLAGLIVEVEAYIGETDLACHARAGRTPRTAVMYGPPGRAYVYLTYGRHWMLNVVTEPEGFPAAVLIRALQPTHGLLAMRERRGRPELGVADGPAKLTQALGIDRTWNGQALCVRGAQLFVEATRPVAANAVQVGARVGLGNTPEPWLSLPWNYRLRTAAPGARQ